MGGSIFLRQGDKLLEMTEQPYESEALLQHLLAQHSNLLAGDQMDSANPRRWLLVTREMGVPSKEQGLAQFSLDHLFLDQDGIPTLVEVKRSSNTQIRREVVGQMLDYAANGVAYWPVEQIQIKWEATCHDSDRDEVLDRFLQGERTPEQFWESVKTNLQAGKVRMVFVADEIPSELLRVVQFLNEQMDPAEVLALEVKQFAGGGQTTLVPRVVGQRMKPSPTPATLWDESTFFAKLEVTSADGAAVARVLYEWGRSGMPSIIWGKGNQYGTFTPGLMWNDMRYQLFRVYTTGAVEMQLGYLETKPPFDDPDKLGELRRKLNAVKGVTLSDALKFPSLPLAALKDKAALDGFLETLSWAIQEIRAS